MLSGHVRNLTTHQSSNQEYRNIVKAEKAFMRRARKDAGKSQQVLAYALLAIFLAFICGLTAIAFSQVPAGY